MALSIVKSGATGSITELFRTNFFCDGQSVVLPTDQAANVMYVFYPGSMTVIAETMLEDLIRTGSFVSLRILPNPDYGKYLNPTHPNYTTPLPFRIVYEELLQPYDLVFPQAAKITPFTEDYLSRGLGFISQRMAPTNWASASYMPSSRDMSAARWALFCKWADK